jgi:hypothetical protein
LASLLDTLANLGVALGRTRGTHSSFHDEFLQ